MSRNSGTSSDDGVTRTVIAGVVTRTQLLPIPTYWRYLEAGKPNFDPGIFDEHSLAERNQLQGMPHAGRGNTCFFSMAGQEMVLRHYRRGGFAQRVSQDRYLFTGLERTRAMREFAVLLELQRLGLRAPPPYACCVIRYGSTYRASLVTIRLPGRTLAECLANESVDSSIWQSIGTTIGQFHSAGLFHADLNAHNIIIDSLRRIALIDFDRAGFRPTGVSNQVGGWRSRNLKRIHRSIKKIVSQAQSVDPGTASEKSKAIANNDNIGYEDGFRMLVENWQAELQQ